METIVKTILKGGLKIQSIKGMLLRPFSTDQLKSLNLSGEIMHGFCLVGENYPEISNTIYAEAVVGMWYSYRGSRNRIGYADSEDGISWERKDGEAGIDVSASGWDSEMIEYPFVFDHDGERYMLYNGNGYGKTGIGLAVLEK
jgi:predicted GH43/DUF377 family glycosyl hydrolase